MRCQQHKVIKQAASKVPLYVARQKETQIHFAPHSILSDPCHRLQNLCESLKSFDRRTTYSFVNGGLVNLNRNRRMERDRRKQDRQAAINREIKERQAR